MTVRKQVTGWPTDEWLRWLAVALTCVTVISAARLLFVDEAVFASLLALFNALVARFLWRRASGRNARLLQEVVDVEATDADEAERLDVGAAAIACAMIAITVASPWVH